jgi:hypothetical protein
MSLSPKPIPDNEDLDVRRDLVRQLLDGFTLRSSANQSKVDLPAWIASHSDLLGSLAPTAVVAIDLATGEHVVGASGLEAMDLFEARFGMNAKAWLHRLAGPIRL